MIVEEKVNMVKYWERNLNPITGLGPDRTYARPSSVEVFKIPQSKKTKFSN